MFIYHSLNFFYILPIGMSYEYINKVNDKIHSDSDYLKYWINK
jgi:hypothetical protein